MKGYVHVYTGDGKGKTTASLGLCVRAVGAGKRVLLVQFLKKGEFSEIKGLKYFGGRVDVMQFGSGRFVRGRPDKSDVELASRGLLRARELMESGRYHMVILDEINVAVNMGLLDVADVLQVIRNRPDDVEIVLTGRYAPDAFVEAADLVTECRMVKHYFQKGVRAREGIEK